MKKLSGIMMALVCVLTGCSNDDAASAAVIGGSDGPTAVFVAGKVDYMEIMMPILIVVVILVLIFWIKKRK